MPVWTTPRRRSVMSNASRLLGLLAGVTVPTTDGLGPGVMEQSWSESAPESSLKFFLRFLRTSLARTGTW